MLRGWLRLLCGAVVAFFVGCTTVRPDPPNSSGLSGVWNGSLTLGCVPPRASPRCLIRQDISFTFLQDETAVSGFYQCSSKDHPCVVRQHGGRVTGVDTTPHALLIKVRMDDGSSCTFGAFVQGKDEMKGGCMCFEVWGQTEKGWWRVQHAY
jgi:hypothetical protein